MSPPPSRRSRAGPSHVDDPPENRQRQVQKAVRDNVPDNLIPTWGVRWTPTPPRKRSVQTSSGAAVLPFEAGLSEFSVNLSPTSLAFDEHTTSIPPCLYSNSVRPKKKRNRKPWKCPPYSVSPIPRQSQSGSARASTEEPFDPQTLLELFPTSSPAESIATSASSSGGFITPNIGVLQYSDDQNGVIPIYNNSQREVSAGQLAQDAQSFPYSAMSSALPQVPTDSTFKGTYYFPSVAPPYYHHGPDLHQHYEDAMDRGTFLISSSDPISRLPMLNKPYTSPAHVRMLHQEQAHNIDAPDKQIPLLSYDIGDTHF